MENTCKRTRLQNNPSASNAKKALKVHGPQISYCTLTASIFSVQYISLIIPLAAVTRTARYFKKNVNFSYTRENLFFFLYCLNCFKSLGGFSIFFVTVYSTDILL